MKMCNCPEHFGCYKKPDCKYCGDKHNHTPFVDCHNPQEPLPDNLEEYYKNKFGGDY